MTTRERDLDVIAVAIQNTADDDNRIDALAALERVRLVVSRPPLAPREWTPGAEYPLPEVDGQVPSSWYLSAKARADAHRIEADCAMRDYDWLDAAAREALRKIAENAESWHREPAAKDRAFRVIASTARAALTEIDSGGKA